MDDALIRKMSGSKGQCVPISAATVLVLPGGQSHLESEPQLQGIAVGCHCAHFSIAHWISP
jgi:hypothetical protein